jgi:hypothetical protein
VRRKPASFSSVGGCGLIPTRRSTPFLWRLRAWWPEGDRELTLHRALIHVIVDIYRHAGHADLIRELIDGAIGADHRWSNLTQGDEAWWASYRDRVEAAARHAGGVT